MWYSRQHIGFYSRPQQFSAIKNDTVKQQINNAISQVESDTTVTITITAPQGQRFKIKGTTDFITSNQIVVSYGVDKSGTSSVMIRINDFSFSPRYFLAQAALDK